MNGVDTFAAEASEFREWALHGADTGADAARNALVRITRLYLTALDLPPPPLDELDDSPDADAKPVSPEERRTVREASRRMPLQYYGEVLSPLTVPPEDPGLGDISDDLEDIYADVVCGLQAYEAGQRAEAIWQWVFGLQHHWGEHATSAIRALHCWLAENEEDRLTSGP